MVLTCPTVGGIRHRYFASEHMNDKHLIEYGRRLHNAHLLLGHQQQAIERHVTRALSAPRPAAATGRKE
jgi:hypothetical protein